MGHTGLLTKINTRQSIFGLSVVATLLISMFMAAFVSAAPLTTMSITPSTVSVNASAGSVSYRIQFTPAANAGAMVVDFCTNTPLLGQSCTAPTGMNMAGAASSDVTINAATDANTIIATNAMTASVAEDVTITTLTNPTSAGVVYARIVTYPNVTEAALYESNDPSNGDLDPGGTGSAINPVDNGSVSLYFNEDVTVSGTVLETMTFCVSGSIINANCAGATVPTITLGEDQGGGIIALQPGTVSTGTLHTQMNTNASDGAVVRLKSSAPCGGLLRLGSNECNIAAALATDVVNNDNSAKFGVRTAAAATTAPGATNPIGTLRAYDGGGGAYYNSTAYKLNYVSGNASGITSVIGDPLLDTNALPATNQNMALTFAATVGTDTPAGTYSTDLSLIAVGTF